MLVHHLSWLTLCFFILALNAIRLMAAKVRVQILSFVDTRFSDYRGKYGGGDASDASAPPLRNLARVNYSIDWLKHKIIIQESDVLLHMSTFRCNGEVYVRIHM